MVSWQSAGLVTGVFLSAGFLWAGGALAAGPFDGNWQGSGSGEGGIACHDQNFTMPVRTGSVSGLLLGGRTSNQIPIQGSVAADGAFAGEIVGQTGKLPIHGKFAGGAFTGGYKFRDCEYHITMHKE